MCLKAAGACWLRDNALSMARLRVLRMTNFVITLLCKAAPNLSLPPCQGWAVFLISSLLMSSASTPVSNEPSEAAASQERAAAFIARWKASSGSERSNYISFLNELTDLLEVPRPDPATADNARNAYVFERAIEMTQRGTTGYIDLHKRGCFVCETKQGVERDEEQAALSDKLRERRRAQRKGQFRARCRFTRAKGISDGKVNSAILSTDTPAILIEARAYGATVSKERDVLAEMTRICREKRNDLHFVWGTDGVTWREGMKDRRKLVELQNQGENTRIYTQSMARELEADLAQLKAEHGL